MAKKPKESNNGFTAKPSFLSDKVSGEAHVITPIGDIITSGDTSYCTSIDTPNSPSTYSHYPNYGEVFSREGPVKGMNTRNIINKRK